VTWRVVAFVGSTRFDPRVVPAVHTELSSAMVAVDQAYTVLVVTNLVEELSVGVWQCDIDNDIADPRLDNAVYFRGVPGHLF
jgi:hypothetical protein